MFIRVHSWFSTAGFRLKAQFKDSPKNPEHIICEMKALIYTGPSEVWFTDGTVLQRDLPLRVFGFGAPGEAVSVTFRDHSTAADGGWRVELQYVRDMPANDAKGKPKLQKKEGEQTLQKLLDHANEEDIE